MRIIRYAPLAEDDLEEIAEFTKLTWSVKQADRYLGEIESCCDGLAVNPGVGRKCDVLRLNLRRIEQGSHVIFFEASERDVFVARILHKSRVPDIRDFD